MDIDGAHAGSCPMAWCILSEASPISASVWADHAPGTAERSARSRWQVGRSAQALEPRVETCKTGHSPSTGQW